MKRNLFFILTAVGMLFMYSCGDNRGKTDSTQQAEDINEQKGAVDENVSDFMVKAADAGITEVELGNLAQQNGVHQRVKNFGAMMVRDHSKANDELKALASSKNVTLPAVLSDEHQKHYDEMKKMTGADFDKHYIDMMAKDHEDVIKLFEDASNSTDADVKAFADKTLPVLRTHLDSAKAISNAVRK